MHHGQILPENRGNSDSRGIATAIQILGESISAGRGVAAGLKPAEVGIQQDSGIAPAIRLSREGGKPAVGDLLGRRPLPEVQYKKQKAIEALLGDKGKSVLPKVIDLVESTSEEQDWPLTLVQVAEITDTEVENWHYILITLVFDCAFEAAVGFLHELYEKVDSLAEEMDTEERDILQRKLFFDIAAAV